MFGAFHAAVVGYSVARMHYLAALSPEERATVLAKERRQRELERLDAAEEVRFAREEIEREGLSGEFAERLLEFARDLARRRES